MQDTNSRQPSTRPTKPNTVGGRLPSICTDRWTFYEDCPNAKKKSIGNYEKEWRDKFDTYPKPYKEIASSKVCLPKIPTTANDSTSRRQNHIYSRFTSEQHRRKGVVDRIEKMVEIQNVSKRCIADLAEPQVEPFQGFTSKRQSDEIKSPFEQDFGNFSLRNIDLKSKSDDGKKDNQQVMNTDDLEAIIDVKAKNPYKVYAKPQRVSGDGKMSKMKKRASLKKKEEEDEDSLAHMLLNRAAENRLKCVVQEFCDSIQDLGGVEANIDPITVNCLFTSGYDTAPAISAPVMLVKQADLPPGLRDIVGASAIQNTAHGGGKKEDLMTSKAAFEKKVKANRNGYRYGAWYMEPSTWKRVKKNVQLQDPKTIKWEATMTDLDLVKREVTEELSSLHILKAFAEFIRHKNARPPEFVVEAEKFSKEKELRDKQKIEAEAKAKQEYLTKNNKWN